MTGNLMDGAKELPLTPALIEELKRKGFNQSEIAEMRGVSRQWVSRIKYQSGLYSKTPRETMNDNYPWDTTGGFSHHYIDRRMRDHGEWVATHGEALSETRRKRLRYFYNSLTKNNLVIEFDPNLPPMGRSHIGGFAYRLREESDKDLMIRVNEHTNLTSIGETLWRLPERSNWP